MMRAGLYAACILLYINVLVSKAYILHIQDIQIFLLLHGKKMINGKGFNRVSLVMKRTSNTQDS